MGPTGKNAVVPQGGCGIRFESIGGLGANLAGKILAEAGVLHLGLNGAQFSSYGSEKKGSPVTTYIRFAPHQAVIRITEPILEPDVIAVFHESLLREPGTLSGLKPGGVLVVNTAQSPQAIRERTGLTGVTISCVNAQQLAIDEKTRANTAMLGALARVIPFLSPEAVLQSIEEAFGQKDHSLVDANVRTFHRGYEEIEWNTFTGTTTNQEAGQDSTSLRKPIHLMGGVIRAAGNSVTKDLSISRQGFLPGLDLAKCIHCAACDQVCPDLCFVWTNGTDPRGRSFQYLVGIDYQYCKGCMKCVEACPTDALSTVREAGGFADEHGAPHHW